METQYPLAATPPMGWNSWNGFGSAVSAEAVRETADAMVASGLKDLGYTYVVIDDCWSVQGGRDANGDLIPDPQRFPDGIQAVADYVHNQGLKFGIYSCASEMTCAHYPGSFGFEEQDARLWASWGVDFLKYDYCFAPEDQQSAIDRYTRMGQALQNSGRQILFSICEWGGRKPWLWARRAGGQAWRISGDVFDSWVNVQMPWGWPLGIDPEIDIAAGLADYAGPGGWNDLDMLVVGLKGKGFIGGGGCTFEEYRTHVSMWSLLCSPLMIGCDVRVMSTDTAELLMNPEIIALNQDPLGRQAVRIAKRRGAEVWRQPLADGSTALGLLNRRSSQAEIAFTPADLNLLDSARGVVRDLWKHADAADLKAENAFWVPPHGTLVLKVTAG